MLRASDLAISKIARFAPYLQARDNAAPRSS